MEEEILPYVAGLMDGEGSITIGISKPSKKKQLKSPSHWLQVGITNTNRELIGWLYEKFGGHISDNSHSPSRKKQRPCWAWRVMSNEAKDFLVSLYPYLRVKKRQAELAIAFQEERSGKTSKTPTEDQIKKRDWYKKEISNLCLGYKTL